MGHIFISYARKDLFFVDRLREDLQRAGIAYWIDREGLSPGTDSWERAIRAAIHSSEAVLWIVSPASYNSLYVRDEVALARLYERKIYPVFAEGTNFLECAFLGTGGIQYIEARTEYTDYAGAFAKIQTALRSVESAYVVPPDSPPPAPKGDPRNPYIGLHAFTEAQAGDFFGREALVKKLAGRVQAALTAKQDRFLAVLGPSGAGKSSVVMAGLIPALKKLHPDWTFLPKMVPGRYPLEALADALYQAMPDKSLTALETDLQSAGGRMLTRLARQLTGEQVVLYIDQFEELFTLTQAEEDRQQFINLISSAATEPDGKLVIILSMRADFYGHPMNYPQLGNLVNQNNEGVLPMTIAELREAIEKPARLPEVGLNFEAGLVAEIIFALREDKQALAGALPLLQYTLQRLFAERSGADLTFAAYDAMGGVQGAISEHCEAVFAGVFRAEVETELAQMTLGQVFLPLVAIDEETSKPTRRRASLDKMPSDPATQTLLNALVNNGLLQRGQEGNERYLEITHEALFDRWARLVKWLAATREDLRTIRAIEREAVAWAAAGRPYLLTLERLQAIYAAIARLKYEISPVAQELIYPQEMLLAELENPATTEQRRLRIGDDLAMLGDPRAGIGVIDGLPDLVWLPVEGSYEPVTFQGGEGNYGTFKVDHFCIAKFQVTYAQYQAFVEAEDGFNNLEWWRNFPKEYQPQKLAEQRTKSWTNPRDSLSWYQAVAFSRWVSHRLIGLVVPHPAGDLVVGKNAEIRLPLEWEWQWAAQGGITTKKYPWGDWQSGLANTSESGLGRAVAVGMYPQGLAACGALDMSGNLWEWCLNDYEDKSINTSINSKVLRGGAFYRNMLNAASESRFDNLPHYNDNHYGFRLFCSSPTPFL